MVAARCGDSAAAREHVVIDTVGIRNNPSRIASSPDVCGDISERGASQRLLTILAVHQDEPARRSRICRAWNGGSFDDFVAEQVTGTTVSRLVDAPDAWGGRAVVAWAEQLAIAPGYRSSCLEYMRLASVLDAIYVAGTDETSSMRPVVHRGA